MSGGRWRMTRACGRRNARVHARAPHAGAVALFQPRREHSAGGATRDRDRPAGPHRSPLSACRSRALAWTAAACLGSGLAVVPAIVMQAPGLDNHGISPSGAVLIAA